MFHDVPYSFLYEFCGTNLNLCTNYEYSKFVYKNHNVFFKTIPYQGHTCNYLTQKQGTFYTVTIQYCISFTKNVKKKYHKNKGTKGESSISQTTKQ
jgi:hypothetical protein